jgi:hypothetical protein
MIGAAPMTGIMFLNSGEFSYGRSQTPSGAPRHFVIMLLRVIPHQCPIAHIAHKHRRALNLLVSIGKRKQPL